jgi:ribosomal protein L37AE/L43A
MDLLSKIGDNGCFAVQKEGKAVCSTCGRPLVKVEASKWSCGYVTYDIAEGEVFIHKDGTLWMKKKDHPTDV